MAVNFRTSSQKKEIVFEILAPPRHVTINYRYVELGVKSQKLLTSQEDASL